MDLLDTGENLNTSANAFHVTVGRNIYDLQVTAFMRVCLDDINSSNVDLTIVDERVMKALPEESLFTSVVVEESIAALSPLRDIECTGDIATATKAWPRNRALAKFKSFFGGRRHRGIGLATREEVGAADGEDAAGDRARGAQCQVQGSSCRDGRLRSRPEHVAAAVGLRDDP